MPKEEKKYGETNAFIKANMKLVGEKDGPRYQVNQEHFNEFLSGKGITKDTIKQIADATSEYNNGTISVLKDLLLEDAKLERVTINTRTHGGVVSTRMTREVETRTPGTGEKVLKHGVVSIKMNLKSRMDKDLLTECANEITDSMK